MWLFIGIGDLRRPLKILIFVSDKQVRNTSEVIVAGCPRWNRLTKSMWLITSNCMVISEEL